MKSVLVLLLSLLVTACVCTPEPPSRPDPLPEDPTPQPVIDLVFKVRYEGSNSYIEGYSAELHRYSLNNPDSFTVLASPPPVSDGAAGVHFEVNTADDMLPPYGLAVYIYRRNQGNPVLEFVRYLGRPNSSRTTIYEL